MEAKAGPALGIIETKGYEPLVRAVDGALKAANVRLETDLLVGGGLASATVSGDVGSVRAALKAAEAIISAGGDFGMTHVIARPDAAVWEMLRRDGLGVDREPPKPSGGGPAGPPALKPEAQTPAVRTEPEVPAVRAEAEVPAVKAEAPVPAVVPEPEAKPKAARPKAPAEPKKAAKAKKPRKTTGKK